MRRRLILGYWGYSPSDIEVVAAGYRCRIGKDVNQAIFHYLIVLLFSVLKCLQGLRFKWVRF